MILNNIKQCNRVCYCAEYLRFDTIKDSQFYLKCYKNKDKDKIKFLYKCNHLKYFNHIDYINGNR